MLSFFGAHTEPSGLNNFAGFVEFHRQLQPNWTLVTQDYHKLEVLKAAHPNGNYIWRVQPDNDNHINIPKDDRGRYVTSAFFDRMYAAAGKTVSKEFYHHVVNEAFLLNSIDLNIQVAEAAIERGERVAVVGLATGQPGDLSELRHPKVIRLMELANAHPENVVVVIHEYGGRDLFTEGFNPAPVAPVPQNHKLWYVGRFRFWEEVFREKKFDNIRMVVSEFGTDHLDDPNLNKPDRPGGPLMNPQILDRRDIPDIAPKPHWGIFNLRNYNANRYGMPFYDAVVSQMAAAYQYIYKDSTHVEGALWFIVGALNRIGWECFDLQRHPELMDKWLQNRHRWLIDPWTPADKPDVPPVIEPPVTASHRIEWEGNFELRFREHAPNGKTIRTMKSGTKLDLIGDSWEEHPDSEWLWYKARLDGREGVYAGYTGVTTKKIKQP